MRKEKPVTNGDMFFTIYPRGIKSNFIYNDEYMKDYVIIYLDEYEEMRVSYNWWTAPYEKEAE